jgi:hypothetical protein
MRIRTIARKNSVFSGTSVPKKFDIVSANTGSIERSNITIPISNHINEYSSFSFLRLTRSIIPTTINKAIRIRMIFKRSLILNLL